MEPCRLIIAFFIQKLLNSHKKLAVFFMENSFTYSGKNKQTFLFNVRKCRRYRHAAPLKNLHQNFYRTVFLRKFVIRRILYTTYLKISANLGI